MMTVNLRKSTQMTSKDRKYFWQIRKLLTWQDTSGLNRMRKNDYYVFKC